MMPGGQTGTFPMRIHSRARIILLLVSHEKFEAVVGLSAGMFEGSCAAPQAMSFASR
jgi:hypothetical protein